MTQDFKNLTDCLTCQSFTSLVDVFLCENIQLLSGASSSYADPLGPLPTRPMTAAGKRDDDFGDEELGDDLLPE